MQETQRIPAGLQAGERVWPFEQIYDHFAQSAYGKILEKKVRFAIYKPQTLSPQQWVDLLGDDVHNLRHMKVSYYQTRSFLEECKDQKTKISSFSQAEQEILLLTAITHDWAEAVQGDIMFYKRSTQNESDELSQFRDIVHEFVETNKISASLGELIIQDTLPIQEDRTSKLGQAFNAIERKGYLQTGLRAWEKSQQINVTELKGKLHCMSKGVVYNQIVALCAYAEIYPPIQKFLNKHKSAISHIVSQVPDNIFAEYNPEEVEKTLPKAQSAQDAWKKYSEQDT